MANFPKRKQRLTDAYAFPGFRPQPNVRGIFGDSNALIIDLVRRSKKACVVAAAGFRAAGTTGAHDVRATCPAVVDACTWSSKFDESSASAVAL